MRAFDEADLAVACRPYCDLRRVFFLQYRISRFQLSTSSVVLPRKKYSFFGVTIENASSSSSSSTIFEYGISSSERTFAVGDGIAWVLSVPSSSTKYL